MKRPLELYKLFIPPHQQESLKWFSSNTKESSESPNILCLGGDGSLQYLVNHLSAQEKEEKVICYFPYGTANDFSRVLNLTETDLSIQLIRECFESGLRTEIPLMSCNGINFVNIATIGGPAKITRADSSALKETLGSATYFFNALGALFDNENIEFELTIDKKAIGEKSLSSFGVFIGQGLFAGGGVRIFPRNLAHFGKKIGVSFNQGGGARALMTSLMGIQVNPRGESSLEYYTGEEVELCASQKLPIKLDGEEYEFQKMTFKKEGSIRLCLF